MCCYFFLILLLNFKILLEAVRRKINYYRKIGKLLEIGQKTFATRLGADHFPRIK